MSWEDQGRQYHMWFGDGHAPPKLKTPTDRASAPAPASLPARLTAVIHGAVGALKRPARAVAEAQLRAGLLPRLTEAMGAWAQGSRMDSASFAHHFFHRDAEDPVVTSLRAAAVGAATATRPDALAAASTQLANAMTAVQLDWWPRFVAHALERARDPVTLAAVAKSLQPVLPAPAAGGKPGSSDKGSGTRLAIAAEGEPDAISEGGGQVAGHGGGAMPEIGQPAPSGDPVPPPVVEPVLSPAAAAEAPAAKPAPTVEAKGGRHAPRATVSPERRTHILTGDTYGNGGGHRYGTGRPDKSEFPPNWSDDKIINEIESVANDPASTRDIDRRGRIKVDGIRDGVDIRVVIEPDGVTIVTGFPNNLPRNPKGK
jgi:hypothetical protein